MLRQIRCGEDFVARGQSDDEVIDLLLAHIASAHPELVDSMTREIVVTWIELVPE